MPKLPTVERFRLSCECEVSGLGPIIAQLTKMGLTNLHFDLIEDVATFKQKTNHEIKSAEFLSEWIKEHPTFKAIEACKHFEANGRTRGSAYPALAELTEAGVLKKLEPGHYARSDVKQIAPPKGKATPAKPAAPDRTRYAVSNPDLIIRLAKRRKGPITSKQLKEAFAKDGRPPSSVSPALADLVEKKKIKRIGDGEYQLAETPKINGGNAAATPVEGQSHG
jgi:hypothetical protein